MRSLLLITFFVAGLVPAIAQQNQPQLTRKQQKMVDKWEASMAADKAYDGALNKADSLFQRQDYQGAISAYEEAIAIKPDLAAPSKAKINDIRIIIQREEARKAAELAKATEVIEEPPVVEGPKPAVEPIASPTTAPVQQPEQPEQPTQPDQPTVTTPTAPIQPVEQTPTAQTTAPEAPAVELPTPPTPTIAPGPVELPKPTPAPKAKPEKKEKTEKEKAIDARIERDVKQAKAEAQQAIEQKKKQEANRAAQQVNKQTKEEILDPNGNPYPEGMTEEIIEKPTVTIVKRVVVKDKEVSVYQKMTHRWGGVFYFKDEFSVTQRIWLDETGKP